MKVKNQLQTDDQSHSNIKKGEVEKETRLTNKCIAISQSLSNYNKGKVERKEYDNTQRLRIVKQGLNSGKNENYQRQTNVKKVDDEEEDNESDSEEDESDEEEIKEKYVQKKNVCVDNDDDDEEEEDDDDEEEAEGKEDEDEEEDSDDESDDAEEGPVEVKIKKGPILAASGNNMMKQDGDKKKNKDQHDFDIPPAKKFKESQNTADESSTHESLGPPYKVFLGNLPETATDVMIRDAFSFVGNIVTVEIKEKFQSLMPTGVAYMELEDEETMQKVLDLNNIVKIEDQAISIKKAYLSDDRGKGSFGGGRPSGGFGRGRGDGGFHRGGRGGGFRGSPNRGGRGGGD